MYDDHHHHMSCEPELRNVREGEEENLLSFPRLCLFENISS